MPKVECLLTIRSLGEVAWLASRVGRQIIELKAEPTPNALRAFWQTLRELQRRWTAELDSYSVPGGITAVDGDSSESYVSRLHTLAAQVYTTEMAARVWATILAGIDLQTGKSDLTRVAINSVNGLLQIRHYVISKLLGLPAHTISQAAELDRLRRRCDRWTDLLIGNVMGQDDIIEFAFDAERARDFAQESNDYDSCSGPNPVDHLVAAGLRLGFLGQLPEVTLDHPDFNAFVQSILSSLPDQSFHRDGSLIGQEERHPMQTANEATATTSKDDDVLLPGISFAKLRQRFR